MLGPLEPTLLVSLAGLFVLMLAAFPAITIVLAWGRAAGVGRCGSCRYDLGESAGVLCPECGGDLREVGIDAPILRARHTAGPVRLGAAWMALAALGFLGTVVAAEFGGVGVLKRIEVCRVGISSPAQIRLSEWSGGVATIEGDLIEETGPGPLDEPPGLGRIVAGVLDLGLSERFSGARAATILELSGPPTEAEFEAAWRRGCAGASVQLASVDVGALAAASAAAFDPVKTKRRALATTGPGWMAEFPGRVVTSRRFEYQLAGWRLPPGVREPELLMGAGAAAGVLGAAGWLASLRRRGVLLTPRSVA